MKAKKSKVALAALLAIGCMPFSLTACGDDGPYGGPDDEPTAGTAGKSSGGSAGKGGKSSGGSKPSEGGEDGEGGEGGAEPIAGTGGGGKGGAGGTSGAGGTGGGGAGGGGTAGTSGGGGTGGGGAGGMSGGGTGGIAGNGGSSGSGQGCGNGHVEGDEVCDHASGNNYLEDDCGDIWGTGNGITGAESDCLEITPEACAMCETNSECAELMNPGILSGNAVEGPATGTSRRALYFKTLDCVRDTACAVVNVLDCYCGTVSAAQCDAGSGNGLCKAVIEQGVETTNPTEISNRLSNVTLGGGLALARVACDKNNCVAQCDLGLAP
jgi:predicted small lipoprotein YifL